MVNQSLGRTQLWSACLPACSALPARKADSPWEPAWLAGWLAACPPARLRGKLTAAATAAGAGRAAPTLYFEFPTELLVKEPL